MAPLAFVANLTTRWRHLHYLQIWPPDGATCISCKFGHQMAQLGLVQNFVIRWRHLHCLQNWPPGCVTCIATLLWIVLLALSVSIDLVSSSARVTSVKSTQPPSVRDTRTQRSDQGHLGPIKKGKFGLHIKFHKTSVQPLNGYADLFLIYII